MVFNKNFIKNSKSVLHPLSTNKYRYKCIFLFKMYCALSYASMI